MHIIDNYNSKTLCKHKQIKDDSKNPTKQTKQKRITLFSKVSSSVEPHKMNDFWPGTLSKDKSPSSNVIHIYRSIKMRSLRFCHSSRVKYAES